MSHRINIDEHYHPQLVLHSPGFISAFGARQFHEMEHWGLSFIKDQGDLDKERSYKLAIRYYHGDIEGPHHFRFYEMNMGGHVELVTAAQYRERKDAIEQHEGGDEADKWDECQQGDHPQVRIMDAWERELLDRLQRRWYALCELISPHVNL